MPAGSRSEAKNSQTGAMLNVLATNVAQAPHCVSLTNSLKKSIGNSVTTQSDAARTRSFTDVLNAMRDTDVIEEEKKR